MSIARRKTKKGWLDHYRTEFAGRLGIEFDDAPADLSLLEEIVLARNRIQHPEDIVLMQASYSDSDLKKRPLAFFVTETERKMFFRVGEEEEPSWFFQPTIDVSREKLEVAIGEVEKFATWFEEKVRERGR